MNKQYFCGDCKFRMKDRDGKCTKHHINTYEDGCICDDCQIDDIDMDEEELYLPVEFIKTQNVVIMSKDEHQKLLDELNELREYKKQTNKNKEDK